jgi:hypothetical protein
LVVRYALKIEISHRDEAGLGGGAANQGSIGLQDEIGPKARQSSRETM